MRSSPQSIARWWPKEVRDWFGSELDREWGGVQRERLVRLASDARMRSFADWLVIFACGESERIDAGIVFLSAAHRAPDIWASISKLRDRLPALKGIGPQAAKLAHLIRRDESVVGAWMWLLADWSANKLLEFLSRLAELENCIERGRNLSLIDGFTAIPTKAEGPTAERVFCQLYLASEAQMSLLTIPWEPLAAITAVVLNLPTEVDPREMKDLWDKRTQRRQGDIPT